LLALAGIPHVPAKCDWPSSTSRTAETPEERKRRGQREGGGGTFTANTVKGGERESANTVLGRMSRTWDLMRA